MTEKVKDMFKESFKEAGVTWKHIYVGDFVNVGLECPIPTTIVFDTDMENFYLLDVDVAFFKVLWALNIDDKYDGEFEFLRTTDDVSVFKTDTMEEL